MLRQAIMDVGGRRFLLALICCIMTAVLTGFGYIDDATYATVIVAVVLGYIGGNTAQKIKAQRPGDAP